MKLLTTNDIHQMPSKWERLVEAVEKEQPDIVVVAGDLFPKDQGIIPQLPFVEKLKKYADKIKDLGAEMVLIMGNDDNQNAIPLMQEGNDQGYWHYIDNKKVVVKGYEFLGMPYVPDYPFGYKYWCHPEFDDMKAICRTQFGEAKVINEDNEPETIDDWAKEHGKKKPIWDALMDLVPQAEDMSKSIWLIHAPPANVLLDVCATGDKVGSPAVLKFIGDFQPMLTVHGHIHESPVYAHKKWFHKEGRTYCIQNGQLGHELHYSILNIEDGEVKDLWNTPYSTVPLVNEDMAEND